MANSHHAHLSCVLKIEPGCQACKMHAMEVLSSLDGVYDVMLDFETKTARIFGEVNPNYCLKILTRCGIHAEIIQVNLTHPRLISRGLSPYGYGSYYNHDHYPRLGGNDYYDHDPYGPYNHNYYGDPYRRSLPEGMWHDHITAINAFPEYSYNNTIHSHGGPVPYASYPSVMEYNPYADHESRNMCNIM